jgi:type I restriction enzyme S subunit
MKWTGKTLQELGKVGRGKSCHRPRNAPHLYGGQYPFVQTGDVQAARFYINDYSQTYSEAGLAQSKLWSKDTLCISIVGANTTATAILGIEACFPDSVIGFIANEEVSDVKFVKYALEQLREKSILNLQPADDF